jgi:hypothetical protein
MHIKWAPQANNRGNLLWRFGDMSHVLGNATSQDLAFENEYLTKGIGAHVSRSEPELTSSTSDYWSPSDIGTPMSNYTWYELDGTPLQPPVELPG